MVTLPLPLIWNTFLAWVKKVSLAWRFEKLHSFLLQDNQDVGVLDVWLMARRTVSPLKIWSRSFLGWSSREQRTWYYLLSEYWCHCKMKQTNFLCMSSTRGCYNLINRVAMRSYEEANILQTWNPEATNGWVAPDSFKENRLLILVACLFYK